MHLHYCEVAAMVIDMLVLIYNKMYDNQFLHPQMLAHVERIDNLIVNKVIKCMCEDINKVARLMAVKQLAKINKALKLESNPKAPLQLKRVPSDDEVFEIVPLDLDGTNKPDVVLLNSIPGAMRVSGDKS